MFEKKEVTPHSSPSLEGGSTLQDLAGESTYHDIDVFGREEDHEVCMMAKPQRHMHWNFAA